MAVKFVQIGVSLTADLASSVDEFATEKGVSRSEIIRAALAVGMPLLKIGSGFNIERALVILEHTQLALTYLVHTHSPEEVDHLIDDAVNNVKQHHG